MIFTVQGESVSQGSLTAVPTNRNWRTVPGVRWVVKDAKPALKPWRKKVADAALEAWDGQPMLEGPVRVRARFMFERPASHYGTGRNAGVLKRVINWVTSHQKGDIDKHLRSVLDALTGVVFKDDCQVAEVAAWKVYAATESGCMIEVSPLEE